MQDESTCHAHKFITDSLKSIKIRAVLVLFLYFFSKHTLTAQFVLKRSIHCFITLNSDWVKVEATNFPLQISSTWSDIQ